MMSKSILYMCNSSKCVCAMYQSDFTGDTIPKIRFVAYDITIIHKHAR